MNGRRQTLAAMSPAALNSRTSLGPTRVTKDSKALGKNAGLAAAPVLAAGARPPANNAPVRMAPCGSMQRRCCLPYCTLYTRRRRLTSAGMPAMTFTGSCYAAQLPETGEQAGA